MPDPQAVVADAQMETAFPNVDLMMRCAKEQKCSTEKEYQDTLNFIHILKAYHKEQIEVAKAIVQAATILDEKKKLYEAALINNNPIDEL